MHLLRICSCVDWVCTKLVSEKDRIYQLVSVWLTTQKIVKQTVRLFPVQGRAHVSVETGKDNGPRNRISLFTQVASMGKHYIQKCVRELVDVWCWSESQCFFFYTVGVENMELNANIDGQANERAFEADERVGKDFVYT